MELTDQFIAIESAIYDALDSARAKRKLRSVVGVLVSPSDWRAFIPEVEGHEAVSGIYACVLGNSSPIYIYPATFVKDGEVFLVVNFSKEQEDGSKVQDEG